MTPHQLASLPLEKRFRLFCQWLGNQPENGTFCYVDVNNCALAQFAKATLDISDVSGFHGTMFGLGIHFYLKNGDNLNIQIAPTKFGGCSPLNFGHFGYAYDAFSTEAGLPRRKPMNRVIAWIAARVIKRKHALAA